jgi:hypothetical protein
MACQEVVEACVESMEPTTVEIESIAVPKEAAADKTVKSTKGAVWGLPSSCRMLLKAEEKDPG